MFLEHGAGVATAVVARRLGVSAAALFHRFGSKRNLVLRALTPQLPDFEAIEAGPDARPIPEQLREIGLEVSQRLRKMGPRMAALRSAGLSPKDCFDHFEEPPPLRLHKSLTRWFQLAIEQGRVRPGDAGCYAMAFLGGLNSRHFFTHFLQVEPELPQEGFVDSIVDLICAGCLPPEDR